MEKQLPVKVVIGPRLQIERDAVLELLEQLAAENYDYFNANQATSVYHKRIADCCMEVGTSSGLVGDLVLKVQEAAQKCDYDEKTPGNGFRSLICVCDMVILHLVSVFKRCSDTRSESTFHSTAVCKDLENYVAILRFFVLSFQQVVLLIDSMNEGCLFPSLEGDYTVHGGFFKGIESLDTSCFYGRSFGFHFVPSVMTIFNVIGVALATYSLSWGSGSAAIGSLLDSGRYLLSPEERAKHIIQVIREADIEFCRGFWNLSEIPPPKLFCPAMEIYQVCHVPMCGVLTLESKTPGVLVSISEPSAHGSPMPIRMCVLSSKCREGLSTRGKLEPLSSNLVIHCHGGGYVATTSKSHESYLRVWAKYLDCPVVSIDYSLSPEFPFPRPTEEVLYAYAWILQNPQKLGWNGKKIILVGDSAGGNLIVSLSLRLIELNVARLPDGLVPMYTPFLFQYLPSPSRVLSFADPLLHMGVVIRCAAAYTNICPEGTEAEISRRDSANSQVLGHKSLLEYVDEVKSKQMIDVSEYSLDAQSILSLSHLSLGMNAAADQSAIYDEVIAEDGDCSMAGETKKEDDKEAPSKGDEAATVHIDQDPSCISLSACNYNHSLINYLKNHPLTATSTRVNGECQLVEDVFDPSEILCKYPLDESTDAPFMYKTRCVAQRITLVGDRPPAVMEKKESISSSVFRSVTSSVSRAFESIAHFIQPNSFPIGHDDRAKLAHSAKVGFYEAAKYERSKAEGSNSALAELMRLNLSRDHLVSPMYTPDEILKQLPPFYFIALHMDPLLDDTITFAKKLRAAGGRIASIDLLHGLPHGFLNFALISDDCYEGARICMRRIEEALNAK